VFKLIAPSSQRERGSRRSVSIYCPLSLWERAGVRAATVHRFNPLILIKKLF